MIQKSFQPKKLLAIRTDHLGDLLLTLPALNLFKERTPTCELHMVASESYAAVLRHLSWLKQVWIPSEVDEAFLRQGFDSYLAFWEQEPLNQNSLIQKIPFRAGYRRGWQRSYLNLALPHQHIRASYRPQVLQNLDLLAMLGFKATLEELPLITLDHSKAGTAGWRIGICIDTAGSDRRYALAHINMLTQDILKKWPQSTVVLLGTGRSTSQAEELIRAIGPLALRVENLVGKTTVEELLALCKTLRILVVGNTGPAHLAAALDIPQVTLFIAQAPSLTRWGPWSLKARILKRSPACDFVCRPPECDQGARICELDIHPAQVLDAIAAVLAQAQQVNSMREQLTQFAKQGIAIASSQTQVVETLRARGWQAHLIPKSKDAAERLRFLKARQTLVCVDSGPLLRWIERLRLSNHVGVLPLYDSFKGDWDVQHFEGCLYRYFGMEELA